MAYIQEKTKGKKIVYLATTGCEIAGSIRSLLVDRQQKPVATTTIKQETPRAMPKN